MRQAVIPASKHDVARLTEAVAGLSTEVRNITAHLAKSHDTTSSVHQAGAQPASEEDYDGDEEDEPVKLTIPVQHRSRKQNQLAVSIHADLILQSMTDRNRPMSKLTPLYCCGEPIVIHPFRSQRWRPLDLFVAMTPTMVAAVVSTTFASTLLAHLHHHGMLQRLRFSSTTSLIAASTIARTARRSQRCLEPIYERSSVITRT